MTPLLREARQSDYEAISELSTALVGFSSDRRASFGAVLAGRDHDLIVAEVEGAVVGCAHLLTYEDLSHGALAGEVLGLIVSEERRRQGIGTSLLREVCRLAKERGVRELHVNTEAENEAAQRLYAGVGAKVVGVQMELNVKGER